MKTKINETEIHQKYYEQICEKLRNDPFAQFLGVELLEVGEGKATAEVIVRENLLNAHGTTHGGVVFSLADVVFAVASNSYGKTSVALSMNIGFLAASWKGTRLRATAVEENRTSRTGWYRIKVETENEVVAILDALVYRKNDYFIPIEEKEA